MTKHKYTHRGTLHGDARTASVMPVVKLRQTKLHWIDERGRKFRKSNGWAIGQGDWPMWSLDIASIFEVTE